MSPALLGTTCNRRHGSGKRAAADKCKACKKFGAGDPLIATVVLPVLQGSKAYKVTWDQGTFDAHSVRIVGGAVLDFRNTNPPGVSSFKATGIEAADGVDPSSGKRGCCPLET
jgi:hypothetical protein